MPCLDQACEVLILFNLFWKLRTLLQEKHRNLGESRFTEGSPEKGAQRNPTLYAPKHGKLLCVTICPKGFFKAYPLSFTTFSKLRTCRNQRKIYQAVLGRFCRFLPILQAKSHTNSHTGYGRERAYLGSSRMNLLRWHRLTTINTNPTQSLDEYSAIHRHASSTRTV